MEQMPETNAAWKAIAVDLRARIEAGEFPPGSRLPSGDRLAAELGVNRNAVHRAVEELGRQGLVVRRTGSGTVVAEREKPLLRRVALLMDDLAPQVNHPSPDLLRGLKEGLGERTHLVVAHSDADPARETRQIEHLAEEVDGLILYPMVQNAVAPLYARLQARRFPIVALDRRHPDTECDAVFTADRDAAREAVAAMFEDGARRVGFMSIRNLRMQSIPERFGGYREAAEAMGRGASEDDVRWFPKGAKLDPPAFRQLVQDALYAMTRRDDPIDALFVVEDHFAHTVLQACANLGLRVPDDLQIATFSDWGSDALPSPWNVHRLVQRKAEIGRTAARLLQERFERPARPTQTVHVPADFYPAGAGLLEAAAPFVD